jgi:hypothetical protein
MGGPLAYGPAYTRLGSYIERARTAPDSTIAARQIQGARKGKTHVTIGLMVYMMGTDRDMIFIGHGKEPRGKICLLLPDQHNCRDDDALLPETS